VRRATLAEPGGSTVNPWLHALRVVRPRQALGRVSRPVRRLRFPAGPRGPLRALEENEALWRSSAFAPLGAAPEAGSRLAVFHGAYGDDVLEAARQGADAVSPAVTFIESHPPRRDDAWHPYVASTRAASWIAAATLEPALRPVVGDAVRRALGRVAANVEDDILGNHVIRNAKALVLGGVAFDDATLRRQGEALLARELPEQVLGDGGHYERSPAYHRLVLRDLLEVRPFVDVEDAVERMTLFAAGSSRPDGAPALFNDGGLDVAPRLELPEPSPGVTVFEETGYVFVNDGDLWLAFDCGPPSPPFLPAHAHADGLSVQLWWKGRPVVVDGGTSTYEPGAQRTWERSVWAHSTVAIGGSDQFVTWGAFRAGPLPAVALLEVTHDSLTAELRRFDDAVHRRRLEWRDRRVLVHDVASADVSESRLIVADDAPDGFVIDGGDALTSDASTSERFAHRQHARALVAHVAQESQWIIQL
jgi:hypothetical protein